MIALTIDFLVRSGTGHYYTRESGWPGKLHPLDIITDTLSFIYNNS